MQGDNKNNADTNEIAFFKASMKHKNTIQTENTIQPKNTIQAELVYKVMGTILF